jgi:hypothetical protein
MKLRSDSLEYCFQIKVLGFFVNKKQKIAVEKGLVAFLPFNLNNIYYLANKLNLNLPDI